MPLDTSASTADKLATYATRLQSSMVRGFLKAEDATKWPLEQGLQRVRRGLQRRSKLSGRRRPRVALVKLLPGEAGVDELDVLSSRHAWNGLGHRS